MRVICLKLISVFFCMVFCLVMIGAGALGEQDDSNQTIHTFSDGYFKGYSFEIRSLYGFSFPQLIPYMYTDYSQRESADSYYWSAGINAFDQSTIVLCNQFIMEDEDALEEYEIVYNGEELNEPYVKEGAETTSNLLTDITVPKGYIFAMGDNRESSTDCREFGCIPIEKVESKVVIRFWPLNKFGKIDK